MFTSKEKPSEIPAVPEYAAFEKEPYPSQNSFDKQTREIKFSGQRPKPEEKRTYYQHPKKTAEPPRKTNYPRKEKFSAGTVVELNASDTLLLMKIPGIGASFARRITAYKRLLGGYYRLQQLQEVYGMYEELYDKITPYLRVDTGLIQPLPVHSVSLDKLKSHPYINFYQARAIIEMRKKKGKINGIDELAMLEEFSGEDIEKMRHYLSFR
ncbi:MAG: helix-hairpin-helix domain-containing protein [Dysgonamonadaceae bacterium]|nr:helix-hairpin-helix domain-containing protein [Dysgonamonadaceae bacterium]